MAPPTPNWGKIRDALWERSQGRCEVSYQPLDRDTFDAHHRRNKGMGGTSRDDRDALSNLLALDPVIHNGGPMSVHGRRGWSEQRGYLVSKLSRSPAAAVPVLIHGVMWRWLTDDGGYALGFDYSGLPNA